MFYSKFFKTGKISNQKISHFSEITPMLELYGSEIIGNGYYKNGGLSLINRLQKHPQDFLKWKQPNLLVDAITKLLVHCCYDYRKLDALTPFRKQLLFATLAAKNQSFCLLPQDTKAYTFDQLLLLDSCNYLIYNTIVTQGQQSSTEYNTRAFKKLIRSKLTEEGDTLSKQNLEKIISHFIIFHSEQLANKISDSKASQDFVQFLWSFCQSRLDFDQTSPNENMIVILTYFSKYGYCDVDSNFENQ